MRRAIVLRTLAVAAVAVVCVCWGLERNAGSELDRRLADVRDLERELMSRRPVRSAWDGGRADSTARSLERALPRSEGERGERREPAAPTFSIGEWAAAGDWKNEGYATPRATIATLLWAAAGGDLGVMQRTLELDDDTRAKAREWFDSLPSTARDTYATPENLLVSVTATRIAPISAQLIWDHQADADHAIIGVLLATEQPRVPLEPGAVLDQAGARPEPSSNRLAALTLRRSASGWRIVVPAAAIDGMARSLREAEALR